LADYRDFQHRFRYWSVEFTPLNVPPAAHLVRPGQPGGLSMIKAMNRKTLETMRDGVKSGADTALKQARRVEWRTPWIYRKPVRPLGDKPWLLGVLIFSSVAAVIGGILYFRKRKQIADRYTMGEPDPGSWDASRTRESLASANP
jgi:hypothetical protein